MSRSIKFAKAGGPEVLEFVEVQVPAPGPNEVRIKSRRSASTAPKPCGGSTTTSSKSSFRQVSAMRPQAQIDGTALSDVTIASGDSIHKDGPGDAIVNLKGPTKIWKNGSGKLYLIGMNDYSVVDITIKDGEGNILWVPVDPEKFSAGPVISGTFNGPGKLMQGVWRDVAALRPKN